MFRATVCLFLCLIMTTAVVDANTGGATLWIQWVYSNPDSMLQDGRICDRFSNKYCDVYFTLCLRNAGASDAWQQKCSIVDHTTQTYDNSDFQNFSAFRALQFSVPAPVPNSYTFQMDIYDSDMVPSYEVIGSFIAEKFELTPTNVFQRVPMRDRNSGSRNKRLKLTVDMKLMCKFSYFGKHCTTKCVPDAQKYDCDENGSRICKPGFTGADCESEDSCFYEPCAAHATCQNKGDGTGRICVCNGQEGPQCYPGYDPCSSAPCMHEGQCHATGHYGESFRCECSEQWAGHRCAERRLACAEAAEILSHQMWTNDSSGVNTTKAVEVCLNGGKCLEYSDRFAYRCVCDDGWTGERCGEAVIREQHHASNLMFITVLLVGAFLAILVIVLTIGLIWRSRRSKWNDSVFATRQGGIVYYNSDRDSTGTVASMLESQRHLSNDLYGSPNLKLYVSPPSTKGANSHRRHHNDVYDECNPLELGSKSALYGTAFENEGMSPSDNVRVSCQVIAQDDSAPPLPERPKELYQSVSRQPSAMSTPTGESGIPLTWDTFKTPTSEKRQPTVYRPLSPIFTPTTVERKSRSSIPI